MFNFKIAARDRTEKTFRWAYAGNGELTLRRIMTVGFETKEAAQAKCDELATHVSEYEFKVAVF